ncbi:hypothetical protein M8J77_004585 [Diaphorina citri]|nr:hypothetical protein M8J77_004585 [Diaphorina citri]
MIVCVLMRYQVDLTGGPDQCTWGVAGHQSCYDHFNSQGISTGNCGARDGHYVKCDDSNILCGTLHCKKGNRNPVLPYLQGNWLSTVIHLEGGEFECKAHTGPILDADSGLPVRNTHRLPVLGLVRDGTPCGEHLICVNQTCTSVFPYMDQGRCPSNNEDVCSSRGICTNKNHCFCDYGWSGPDCSIQVEVPTRIVPVDGETTTNSLEKQMVKKVTPYGHAPVIVRSTNNQIFYKGIKHYCDLNGRCEHSL